MEQKPRIVSPFSNESRNAYVVEHLTSSMLELLKEKSISEISISELCAMAGVGRTSFYRNYEEKEDEGGADLDGYPCFRSGVRSRSCL